MLIFLFIEMMVVSKKYNSDCDVRVRLGLDLVAFKCGIVKNYTHKKSQPSPFFQILD